MARQLEMRLPRHGGKRRGAGRKRQKAFKALPHRARPAHQHRHPVLVTMRAADDLPNLREWRLASAIGLALREAAKRPAERCRIRVTHFSIQSNHLHLLVETDNARDLGHGMRGLGVRLARAVNRELGRKGSFGRDRYHARALTSPTEVRRALVYVLNNWRKHTREVGEVDISSSARWFEGWAAGRARETKPAPVHRARTWLMTTGWKRFGLIQADEHPLSDGRGDRRGGWGARRPRKGRAGGSPRW